MRPDPLPKTEFLDPRPSDVAESDPIAAAVNIPLEELELRVNELPPREEVIRVCGEQVLAEEAVRRLCEWGRAATFVEDSSYGLSGGVKRLWSPNDWLREHLMTHTVSGSALDLGCGGGRDTVYLAAHGMSVLAVDKLPDSLERGSDLAERYLPSERGRLIEWQVADLLADYDPGRKFDLVVSCFFFDRSLIRLAKQWLAPGGVLIVEAFTTVRQEKEGKPSSPDRVVQPGEMQELLDGLQVLQLIEGDHPRGHTARAWAMKDE